MQFASGGDAPGASFILPLHRCGSFFRGNARSRPDMKIRSGAFMIYAISATIARTVESPSVSSRSALKREPVLSLPEMVYRQLRSAILNGVFTPGQMLRQEEVAVQLGVSRSPLREALPRLEAEGIVVLQPRRGYSVATLDPKDIIEAFDLRILVERELARRSIALRTAADIAHAQSLLRAMNALVDNGIPDHPQWFELNGEFHDALLSPADCPQHMRALSTTRGVIEAYIRAEARLTGDIETAQFEHSLMVQTFAAGEAEPFMRLIREHSEHTRLRLLQGLGKVDAKAQVGGPVKAEVRSTPVSTMSA